MNERWVWPLAISRGAWVYLLEGFVVGQVRRLRMEDGQRGGAAWPGLHYGVPVALIRR
jgi:hypothetical protein